MNKKIKAGTYIKRTCYGSIQLTDSTNQGFDPGDTCLILKTDNGCITALLLLNGQIVFPEKYYFRYINDYWEVV